VSSPPPFSGPPDLCWPKSVGTLARAKATSTHRPRLSSWNTRLSLMTHLHLLSAPVGAATGTAARAASRLIGAGRRNDTVHAQILDELAVDVGAVRAAEHGEFQIRSREVVRRAA